MVKNSYPGKFIVFEGLDGSGQSTMVEILADFLSKQGKRVFTTKEPTIGNQEIRKVLNRERRISPQELQTMFAKDREQHLANEIVPALIAGKTVICDRYMFSSFAFGWADGCDLNWLLKINNEFLLPDTIFWLDASAKTCMSRINKRGNKTTLFEKQERLARVRQNYESLAKKFSIICIDAEPLIKDVFSQIKDYFLE